MMGISGCGVYLPYYSISGERIAAEWGYSPTRFTKRFASYDEDSLTLGVEAALKCRPNHPPDTLIFASTTPPYKEKQSASIIAAALDLPRSTKTIDITGSLRAATTALILGLQLLNSNTTSSVMITSGDCRPFKPGAPDEVAFGDGAAAVVLEKTEKNIAEFIASCSITDELMHTWRREEDEFVDSGDVRFSQKFGYERNLTETITELLKRNSLKPSDITKVILPLPELRPIRNILKNCGFNREQWHDPLTGFTGFTGVPHPFTLLVSALENADRGELILLCGYGDGADAILLKAIDVDGLKRSRPAESALKRHSEIATYTRYLDFRNRFHRWDDYLKDAFTSTILINRESTHNLRLKAKKCGECGAVLTLPLPVCPHCRNDTDFIDFKLSRRGRIFTYSQEHYVPTPDAPITLCSIDLEGGGRILTQMTDYDYKDVRIGMEVELTFRRIHQAGGIHHYWWKARPV